MDDKPQYYLKVAAIGPFPKLPISEEDYIALSDAKHTLSIALRIEEKFDLVLANFLDLEKKILTTTAEYMVSLDIDYDRIYEIRSSLNRRMVNFITSGKMYTELISSIASKCTNAPLETKKIIEELKNKQYDESLDYRTMESLRNHVMHSGVAVHKLSFPTGWKENNEGFRELEFRLDLYAQKEILMENSGFKRAILNELPDNFDLKKAARSYIGSISLIHENVRRLTKENTDKARSIVQNSINKYALINNGESIAVSAYDATTNKKDKKIKGTLSGTLKWDNVRAMLLAKNESIGNMNKRYISNSIEKTKTAKTKT